MKKRVFLWFMDGNRCSSFKKALKSNEKENRNTKEKNNIMQN